MEYHNYFHDAEFTLSNSDIIFKEKGRLFKNVDKGGSLICYSYEINYYLNGEKLPGFPTGDKFIEWHFSFTDPEWAFASPEEINRAIIRRSKK